MIAGIILIIIGIAWYFYSFVIISDQVNYITQQTVQYLGFICGSIFIVGGVLAIIIDNLKHLINPKKPKNKYPFLNLPQKAEERFSKEGIPNRDYWLCITCNTKNDIENDICEDCKNKRDIE